MPKISLRYVRDMHEICPRYAKDMPKICPKYAQDMTIRKTVLTKCLPDKTSKPVLTKRLPDKTSKAVLTKRLPDKTSILTKRLLTIRIFQFMVLYDLYSISVLYFSPICHWI